MKISRVRPELAFLDDYKPEIERDDDAFTFGEVFPRYLLTYNIEVDVSEQELKEILGD